ncbi:hypothetical protein [Hyphomicrobium sp.]|jgi:hypothetical protein|uniref:hypothetical protein n=1 Tax=Hyphomicrobium sp. TaxID=82 RepID=UPI003563D436
MVLNLPHGRIQCCLDTNADVDPTFGHLDGLIVELQSHLHFFVMSDKIVDDRQDVPMPEAVGSGNGRLKLRPWLALDRPTVAMSLACPTSH